MGRAATKTTTKSTATDNGNGEKVTKGTNNIRSQVQKSGGIARVTLGDIRDELGHARLGKTVLQNMAAHLTENGLGYMPAWMLDENPLPRQWEEVHVYERDGSPRSVILDAVSDPANHDIVAAFKMFSNESETDYSALDSESKLAMVKAIVCS